MAAPAYSNASSTYQAGGLRRRRKTGSASGRRVPPPLPGQSVQSAEREERDLTIMETGFHLITTPKEKDATAPKAAASPAPSQIHPAYHGAAVFAGGVILGVALVLFAVPRIPESLSMASVGASVKGVAADISETANAVVKDAVAAKDKVQAATMTLTVPADKPQAKPAAAVVPAAPTYETHRVAPGETLGVIARDQLGSAARWSEIAELNKLKNPSAIEVGTDLLLPKR